MNRVALLVGGSMVAVLSCIFLMRGHADQPEAAPLTPQRTITADGSATVVTTPDSARVFLGVITSGKTVAAARAENSQIVAKVQTALLALKIADLKSRTRNNEVSILYDDKNKHEIVGYSCVQSFSVLVKEADPEKLAAFAGRILDAGLQNGVNSQGSIEFFKEDDTEMRRQSMTKAVEDAIANANAYAAGAKLKNLSVVQISEHGSHGSFGGQFGGIQGGFNGGFGGGGAAPGIVAGNWNVTRKVQVVFRY
jgi:uncharacterized protein YggE